MYVMCVIHIMYLNLSQPILIHIYKKNKFIIIHFLVSKNQSIKAMNMIGINNGAVARLEKSSGKQIIKCYCIIHL